MNQWAGMSAFCLPFGRKSGGFLTRLLLVIIARVRFPSPAQLIINDLRWSASKVRVKPSSLCTHFVRVSSNFLPTRAAGSSRRNGLPRFPRRGFSLSPKHQGKRTTAFSTGISLRRLSALAVDGGFQFPSWSCTSNDSKTYGTPSAPRTELPFMTWKCRCGPSEWPELPSNART